MGRSREGACGNEDAIKIDKEHALSLVDLRDDDRRKPFIRYIARDLVSAVGAFSAAALPPPPQFTSGFPAFCHVQLPLAEKTSIVWCRWQIVRRGTGRRRGRQRRVRQRRRWIRRWGRGNKAKEIVEAAWGTAKETAEMITVANFFVFK